MKLKLTLYFYVILLFSCSEKKETYFYPSRTKIDQLKNRDTIFLENSNSLDELIQVLRKNEWENGKQPILPIKRNSTTYYLTPLEFENKCLLPSRIKRRNILMISRDSIMKNEIVFPISKLDSLLRKDLLNNDIEKDFAENHKKLVISFLDKPQNINDVKQSLIRLFNSFNEINNRDTLELNISMNKTFMPPPIPE